MNFRRRVSVGLLDQAVVALANASNILLAVFFLKKSAVGPMLLSITFAYFAVGLGRAFVGEVLLTHAPRFDGEERRHLIRDGAAAALAFGVTAMVILAAMWGLDVHADLGDLVWAAPAVPAILLQDTGRQAALAAAAPGRALAIDAGWVLTQVGLAVVFQLTGLMTSHTLLLAWGVGAAVAAVGWLIRDRVNPFLGNPRRWLTRTRHLTGWFTTTAIVAQTSTLAIALGTTQLLSAASFTLLRLTQVGVLQPVQNLITAMNSLLVPRASRFVAAGDRAALRRQTLRASAALSLVGLISITVATLAARPVLTSLKPDYLDAAPLALPISVQTAVYLIQVPFTSALRGMQRGRSLLVQYVFFSTASLALLVVGAYYGDLTWATWGLTGGSAFGLVVMVLLYFTAERSITAPRPVTAAPTPAPAP